MPFEGERATGESLIRLRNSKAVEEFIGVILQSDNQEPIEPPTINPQRSNWSPRRVIAIDGSNLMHRVNNGLPAAEAGLLTTSVVAIDLEKLQRIPEDRIPSPRLFREMEDVAALEAVLPGLGVVRRDVPDDTALNFFRQATFDTLSSSIAKGHETLLDTLHDICKKAGFRTTIDCPMSDCDQKFIHCTDSYHCQCNRREQLFETDVLRLHEYFDDGDSAGQALNRLMSTIEILVLLNVLRFFVNNAPAYLASSVFVLDGPLAIFGTPASLLGSIRTELKSLNQTALERAGTEIALFGLEKSGRFKEHWQQLDWQDGLGPRSRFPEQTTIVPDGDYISTYVKPRNRPGKDFGEDTHFGRVVLYKTNRGKHAVIHVAMLNDSSGNLKDNSEKCYVRLGDILDVVDQVATYMYDDALMPIVRAHAHASIPLKQGADIISTLLGEP